MLPIPEDIHLLPHPAHKQLDLHLIGRIQISIIEELISNEQIQMNQTGKQVRFFHSG
jgi:hypothetical protein